MNIFFNEKILVHQIFALHFALFCCTLHQVLINFCTFFALFFPQFALSAKNFVQQLPINVQRNFFIEVSIKKNNSKWNKMIITYQELYMFKNNLKTLSMSEELKCFKESQKNSNDNFVLYVKILINGGREINLTFRSIIIYNFRNTIESTKKAHDVDRKFLQK